jgi:hypothetical protein
VTAGEVSGVTSLASHEAIEFEGGRPMQTALYGVVQGQEGRSPAAPLSTRSVEQTFQYGDQLVVEHQRDPERLPVDRTQG